MPTREEIKPQVVAKLKAVTQKGALVDKEASALDIDLGMSPALKQAMGTPYTAISKKYPTGLVVNLTDAGNCKTVKASIDLVNKRANGDAS